MTISQVSIFLENRYGTFNKVADLLADAGVHIIAATVADTQEFGIMRILVNDPRKTYSVLKENGVSAYLTDVFAVVFPGTHAGAFRDAISLFTRAGLNIEYMYSFIDGGNLILVMRTDHPENTRGVIRDRNLKCLSEADLGRFR